MAAIPLIKQTFWSQPLSKNEEAVFKMGFRVLNGIVYGPSGELRKPTLSVRGYMQFSVRIDGKKKIIKLHRLIAYQKYGEELYNHQCVRHLDGNTTNNDPANIALGSQQDNLMDIQPEVRRLKAVNAINSRWGNNV